ncbi:helix-turn-helix domain-containing protein [Alkalihalobacterium alkalinitrilicum]|uniref:helix-turn-helix domain-containing protein n=1 Tax=Alkalihalobacterium alkalinitrilicum TaxID=427920 RepID=UPI000994F94D|nr:helix-turn-helix transcriptional regulator [Alkalihalobacterium alkalinitrilicum]
MFSERLKKARKLNNLTQEGLAKKIKTTKGTISNYENGHSSPSNEMLTDLANTLGVTTDFLLGRTDVPYFGVEKDGQQYIDFDKLPEDKFDPLAEINKRLDELGIKDIGFYDIDKWKDMSREDVEEVLKHFEWVAHKAKERKKKD